VVSPAQIIIAARTTSGLHKLENSGIPPPAAAIINHF
jgi:hypothetical protein